MAKTYPLSEERTVCPDCGEDLIVLQYRGLCTGCPECIPDGLVKSYAVSI